MIAFVYTGNGDGHTVEEALNHNLLEFAELFLFLLAAMTYVNAMDERLVFQALRAPGTPGIWLPQSFLVDRPARLLPVAHYRQPHNGTGNVRRTDGRWQGQYPLCQYWLHQCRGRCQCRWRLFSLW